MKMVRWVDSTTIPNPFHKVNYESCECLERNRCYLLVNRPCSASKYYYYGWDKLVLQRGKNKEWVVVEDRIEGGFGVLVVAHPRLWVMEALRREQLVSLQCSRCHRNFSADASTIVLPYGGTEP